jgi:hypothetical protein
MAPSAASTLGLTALPFAVGATGVADFARATGDPTRTRSNAFPFQGNIANAVRKQLAEGKFGGFRKSIRSTLGFDPEKFNRQNATHVEALEAVNDQLANFNLGANIRGGRLKFRDTTKAWLDWHGISDTDMSDIGKGISTSEAVKKANNAEVHVHVGGSENPEEAGKRAGKAAKKELDKMARERTKTDA